MVAKVTTKYEGDNGDIHGIIMSPDYASVAGTPPTGTVSSPIKAKISKSNREFGLRPRGARLARTVGTAPDTFKKYSFLPCLTPAEFATAAWAIGVEIQIGANLWVIVAKEGEDY